MLKAPLLSVVTLPRVVVVAPSDDCNLIVIDALAGKPVPDTVIVSPTL